LDFGDFAVTYRDLRGVPITEKGGIIPLLTGRKAVGGAKSHMILITEISRLCAGAVLLITLTLRPVRSARS